MMGITQKNRFSHYLTTVAKPSKQRVITNKILSYVVIQLNPALRFGVRHLALDG